MKKAILSFIIIFTNLATCFAQEGKAFDKYTNKICDCFTRQKSKAINMEEAGNIIGDCMSNVDSTLLSAVQKETKIKILDQDGINRLGQLVGAKMIQSCYVFRETMQSFSEKVALVKISPSPVLDSTAKETCDCLGKQKIKNNNADSLVSFCMGEAAVKFFPRLLVVYNIKDNDADKLKSIGEAVSQKLRSECAYYREKVIPVLKTSR